MKLSHLIYQTRLITLGPTFDGLRYANCSTIFSNHWPECPAIRRQANKNIGNITAEINSFLIFFNITCKKINRATLHMTSVRSATRGALLIDPGCWRWKWGAVWSDRCIIKFKYCVAFQDVHFRSISFSTQMFTSCLNSTLQAWLELLQLCELPHLPDDT